MKCIILSRFYTDLYIFRSDTKQNTLIMGHRLQASSKTRTGAVRETHKTQPISRATEAYQHTILERPYEPSGERM